MKNPRPPRSSSSPPPRAPADAACSRDAIWQSGSAESSNPGHGAVMGMAGLAFFLILLPAYGLILLVLTLIEAIKGLPLSYADTLRDPLFWVPGIGTALAFALLMSVMRAMPRVIRFSFDLDRQVLRYTETRVVGKPIDVELGFDAIASVTPYRMATHARTGHLGITLKGKRGKYVSKRMGMADAIPVTELETLIERLRPWLGKRATDLIDLDS